MDSFALHHIASGIALIRLTAGRPNASDLISDPDLWRDVYFEHRDEVLAAYGPDCEAARRFEPGLILDEDEDDDSDDD